MQRPNIVRGLLFCSSFLLIILFQNCNSEVNRSHAVQFHENEVKLQYAKGFRIENFDTYKILTVLNPWNDYKIYKQYVLYHDSLPEVLSIPERAEKIQIPIKSIVSLSSTFNSTIERLGELDKVVAIDNIMNVYNEKLHKRFANGKVKQVGESPNVNYEQLIELKADIVLLTAWGHENAVDSRLKKLSLNPVYDIDWMETDPLGRAEWIKFIAAFFDKSEMADSIFRSVSIKYESLKTIAQKVDYKPTILHGFDYKGTWYVPGGKSYVATFYKDAGANYLWKSDSSTGSVPLSVEAVISKGLMADVWITGIPTKDFLSQMEREKRMRQFKPALQNQIFTNDLKINDIGANDYWNSGIINPDKILSDLINIFHPKILNETEMYYFRHIDCSP